MYVESLRKSLANHFDFLVATTGLGSMTELSLLNFRHIWRPLYVVEIFINSLLILWFVAAGRIRRNSALFVVHGGANLAPLFVARIARIPIVWYLHETTPSIRHFVNLGRFVLRKDRDVIAVVANTAKEVYNLKNYEFLPGFVDTYFWTRNAISDDLRKNDVSVSGVESRGRPLRILAVGNLNPLKGLDILLESLLGFDGSWHLQIVGAELATHEKYVKTLRVRASELIKYNVQAKVDFLGWQDKCSVRELMSRCDVFVLPSRSEACPLVLLEALAMGCRCIVSDVGDARAILKECSEAWIFQPESIIDCTLALNELRKLRDSGLVIDENHISSAWEMSSVVSATFNLYSRLLQPRG